MSHYWTADDPPETRKAQAEDWLEDLIEYTPEVVEAACREWRRNESRRPTPADIRRLAIRVQDGLPLTPEQREESRHRLRLNAFRERGTWYPEWGPRPDAGTTHQIA